MKKFFVLFVMLSLLRVMSGISYAFTLEEHVDGVKKYAAAFAKSPEARKTLCDTMGKLVKDPLAMEGQDSVRYTQGALDLTLELRPMGDLLGLATRNPAFKLPNGSGVGDPISGVLKMALVPGDYSNRTKDNVRTHMWIRDGIVTLIDEYDGKISSIVVSYTKKLKGITINDVYTSYLIPGAPEKAEAPEYTPLPADSELNNSTDAKVINSYPMPPKDKNTLGIQHRGTWKLYSQKKYKEAYAGFSKLAKDYAGNYLSAYWAGESALKLKKNDDARTWFKRALEINPNYKPASEALDNMDGKKTAKDSAASASKGWTPLKERHDFEIKDRDAVFKAALAGFAKQANNYDSRDIDTKGMSQRKYYLHSLISKKHGFKVILIMVENHKLKKPNVYDEIWIYKRDTPEMSADNNAHTYVMNEPLKVHLESVIEEANWIVDNWALEDSDL
ncbi:hypothetical protein FACS1894187_14380 [Synergistales bacterium]|nr:hypothetical protein FACS1894187_14380 [Synergistales bacterium]